MGLSTVGVFKNLNLNSDKYIHLEGDTLRKLQIVLLGIADDIIDVCESEGIRYHLGGGTALGAVRHGGFIPWDDDMDINIMGSQRDLFIGKFREKYGDKYWIHSYDTPNYGMEFTRIRLKKTICRTREDIGNDECGFYVDLFFVENTFNDPIRRRLHGWLCMGVGFFLSCRNFYKNRELMRFIAKDNPEVKQIFELKIFLGRLLAFASVKTWAVFTHKCYTMCKNNASRLVSIPSGRKHYFGEIYPREGMEKTTSRMFEGHEWQVPKDYNRYFTALYGEDYMTPPPQEQQEKHVVLELKFPDERI